MNKCVFLLLVALVFPIVAKSQSAPPAVSRSAIEAIVKDYLLANPSVIRDAMQNLQIEEEKGRQSAVAAALVKYKNDLVSDALSPIGGNPNGDVTVVEFYDYNCGYCRKAAPALSELKNKDKALRVVYKELPILGPESVYAARAALAAGKQGKFIEFHEAMMTGPSANAATVKNLSTFLKLDYAKLLKDMADPDVDIQLARNAQLATNLNINGTPAFVIGERLIPGATDLSQLLEIVKAERVVHAAAKKQK